MNVKVDPGKYVLAVSGGVDSMVLLDLLSKNPEIELVVAHFNHGIRKDSAEDEKLVKDTAKRLDLPFEIGYGMLGADTNEEAARTARYQFLEAMVIKHQARAIITAHHQDDLIETAFINLLRGTGRKGVVAIMNNKKISRPLLSYSKEQVLNYAKSRGLHWREDETNTSDVYLRNHIRRHVTAGLNHEQREQILKNVEKVAKYDGAIDKLIASLSQYIYVDNHINRTSFATLPASLGDELMIYWLRQNKVHQFDKKTVNRLNLALRTSKSDKAYPINRDVALAIGPKTAHFSFSV